MSAPKTPPDPWANFPGGNPFGPGGPFAGGMGAGAGGDPFANLDAWLRQMGVDPMEFRRLAEEMQRNLQEAFRNMGQDPTKSFVSGFSVRVGPDGKPNFQTFGNKPQVKPQPGTKVPHIVSDEREPLTDIIDEDGRLAITMELPGVEKKDIQLHVTPEELEISVDTERRKYHKRVALPRKVVPETTKATYNNGVLDVTIEKQGGGKPSGLKVNVE